MVDPLRLELRTFGLKGRYSNQLSYGSIIYYGGCGGNRTHDPRIKSPMLYLLSYTSKFGRLTENRTQLILIKSQMHHLQCFKPIKIMVDRTGIEPVSPD